MERYDNTACLYANSVSDYIDIYKMSPAAVWQIWLLLLSFFVVSAVVFYLFFKHTTLL
jgi:hypothetical protein